MKNAYVNISLFVTVHHQPHYQTLFLEAETIFQLAFTVFRKAASPNTKITTNLSPFLSTCSTIRDRTPLVQYEQSTSKSSAFRFEVKLLNLSTVSIKKFTSSSSCSELVTRYSDSCLKTPSSNASLVLQSCNAK